MASSLSRKLNELEPNQRTPNLLNLISSLTISELRLLRSRLITVDFRTDIISRLPVELQLCVVDYISSSDVLSYINVSRTWRQIWLQDKIINHVVDNWYPGLFKLDEKHEDTETYGRRKAAFLRMLQRDSRRSKGKFRSVLFHGFRLGDEDYFKLDESLHPSGKYADFLSTTPSDRGLGGVLYYYRDGKLAWNPSTRPAPDNGVIVLDDLRTRTRKMFKAPGALMAALWISLRALGDKLVVGVDSRVAHVWHMETNEYKTFTLPSRIYRCKSEGECVSLITDDGAIFIWNFRGRSLQMDMSKPRDIFASLAQPRHGDYQPSDNDVPIEPTGSVILTRAHIDVIIHPTEPGVYFVVTMNPMTGSHIGTVSIHEYVDSKYSRTYKLDLPPHKLAWQNQFFLGVFSLLDCYPIDPHGTFIVASLTQSTADTAPISISITFNVTKRDFSVLSQIIPLKAEQASSRRDLRRGVHSRIWRTQTTISLSNLWELGYRVPLLTLSPPHKVPSLDRTKAGSLQLALANVEYGLDPVRGKRISFRNMPLTTAIYQPCPLFSTKEFLPTQESHTDENYDGYVIPEATDMEELTQPSTCRGICGDDDFLIVFGDDSYTVWSFNDDVSREVEPTAA